MNKALRTLFFALLIIGIILGISLFLIKEYLGKDKQTGLNTMEFNKYGSYFQINKTLTPFTLESTKGMITIPVKGKINIITPQYINCPDICPLETKMMLYIMNKTLEERINDKIVFITIDVDPWRDNVNNTRAYMEYTARDYLDKINWIWVIDDIEKMQNVWKELKIYVEKNTTTGLVTHTGGFYIIGPEGKVLYFVAPNTEGWSNPLEFARGLWTIVYSVYEKYFG